MKANRVNKSYLRPSLATTAIFAVIILHFVSQFILFRNEQTSLNRQAINERSVEVRTEPETKKPDMVKIPEAVRPIDQPEPKFAPSRTVIKKKEHRESRSERLRRLEKVLTGV